MRSTLVSCLVAAALATPFVGAAPSEGLKARAASCGVRGFDKGNPEAYWGSSAKKYASQAACSARCNKSKKCKAFAYGSGECLLYTASV